LADAPAAEISRMKAVHHRPSAHACDLHSCPRAYPRGAASPASCGRRRNSRGTSAAELR